MRLALLLLVACGSPRRGVPVDDPVRLDARAARGEAVFVRNCYPCHPGGAGGLGPALNHLPLPRGAIKTQVRSGFGAMPAFPEVAISDEELDALVDYLVALRRS